MTPDKIKPELLLLLVFSGNSGHFIIRIYVWLFEPFVVVTTTVGLVVSVLAFKL